MCSLDVINTDVDISYNVCVSNFANGESPSTICLTAPEDRATALLIAKFIESVGISNIVRKWSKYSKNGTWRNVTVYVSLPNLQPAKIMIKE